MSQKNVIKMNTNIIFIINNLYENKSFFRLFLVVQLKKISNIIR